MPANSSAKLELYAGSVLVGEHTYTTASSGTFGLWGINDGDPVTIVNSRATTITYNGTVVSQQYYYSFTKVEGKDSFAVTAVDGEAEITSLTVNGQSRTVTDGVCDISDIAEGTVTILSATALTVIYNESEVLQQYYYSFTKNGVAYFTAVDSSGNKIESLTVNGATKKSHVGIAVLLSQLMQGKTIDANIATSSPLKLKLTDLKIDGQTPSDYTGYLIFINAQTAEEITLSSITTDTITEDTTKTYVVLGEDYATFTTIAWKYVGTAS